MIQYIASSGKNPFTNTPAPRSARRSSRSRSRSRHEEAPESDYDGDMGMQEKTSSRSHED